MSARTRQNQNGGSSHFGDDHLQFEARSNRFGWMVSYADLMTIILTFMILLLSISTIAQTKFDLLVEALTGRKVGNLQEVKIKIDDVIKKEALGGEVQTNIDEHGLKIQFSNALLFDSGKAELRPRAVDIFEPIGQHLVNDLEPEYGIVIEGYTDDVPISNGEFESNWELSSSRSIDVMERLAEEGLDPRRMSVQGFADTRPATEVDLHDVEEVDNLTEEELAEARAANRRVVIRIDRLQTDVLERVLDDLGVSTEAANDDGAPAMAEETAIRNSARPTSGPTITPDMQSVFGGDTGETADGQEK